MENIIFACGGTLGHINPAIAIAWNIFHKYNYNPIFVSTNKEKRNKTYENYNFIKKIYYYEAYGFNRKKVIANINSFIKNYRSYQDIKKLIKETKPVLVISMGGSIGTIAIKAALNQRIKTIIHEQNSILGLGNRMVCKKVDRLLLSYKEMYKINKQMLANAVYVGNPIESKYHIINKSKNPIYKEDIILIFGGSNGAKTINDFFINNYTYFNNDVYNGYRFVLFTGSKYYMDNIDLINKKTTFLEVKDKTNDMMLYYKRAKIVICRAGATTISEVMSLQKVCLLIPSPNVTNNHQYYNALYYKKRGCIEMISENELNPKIVDSILKTLLEEKTQQTMKQNILNNQNTLSVDLFLSEVEKVINI